MLRLHYWFTRTGRAEQIRLLLVELDLPWEEVDLAWRSPGWEAAVPEPLWFAAQPAIVEPDGFSLTQSGVILSYLARRHGLAPADPRAAAVADALVWTAEDLRTEVARARRDPDAWPVFVAATWPQRWLAGLEHRLALNGTGFLVGETLTHADLAWFDALEQVTRCTPSGPDLVVAAGSRVEGLVHRVAARPRIAAWLRSERRPPPEDGSARP